jgi:hypothetical protein
VIRLPCAVVLFAALVAAQQSVPHPLPAASAAPQPPTTVMTPVAATPRGDARPIDLVICLDISGSMQGLINAARQNLWAVVNDLATLQPTPTLRVALLSFGCSAHPAEHGYVKVETDFTTDLDLVSQQLFALQTNGGEEYVARVMQKALADLTWSPQAGALQLMFVAGNEAATQDPQVDVAAVSKAAIERGIVVNTIYCGDPDHADGPGWREVSKLADGHFAAIQQDREVVVVTPYDQTLAHLGTLLNPTYVPYGAQRESCATNQWAQDSNAAALNVAAAAQRAQTKAGLLYCNPHWDLVDALDDPKFKLEEVKPEDLPEALRALTTTQLREHVAVQKRARDEVKAKLERFGKLRDAFLQAEQKQLGSGGPTRFEQAVLEPVRQQAAARGFHRAAPAPVPSATAAPAKEPAGDVDSPFAAVVRAAAAGYEQATLLTAGPELAPTDCRAPAPAVRLSTADGEHGDKLYMLYGSDVAGVDYAVAGTTAPIGQTLVKQAWEAVPGEPQSVTAATERHGGPLLHRDGGTVRHGGAFRGLFVMHKLAPDTPGTDQGWVYGTLDAEGRVTGAGAMASCIRCHQDAPVDRRFGLR